VRANRYCCATSAPPPSHVAATRRLERALERRLDSVGHEVERRVALHHEGSRAWWVSTKTGVWNGGSSPHQPFHGVVPPRAAVGPEHVAAQDGGADVLDQRSRVVVVEPGLASFHPMHGTERAGRERPVVQVDAAFAEGFSMPWLEPAT
jgi:hypothetical protein